MANEFGRNIQDATYVATFALPTTLLETAAKTSAIWDIGTAPFKDENIEVELSVPALSSTIAPAAATVGVTYQWESSSTSTFSVVARKIVSQTIVGSGSGVVATVVRGRLPSNCERYIRAKIFISTTCTDASAVTATASLRF